MAIISIHTTETSSLVQRLSSGSRPRPAWACRGEGRAFIYVGGVLAVQTRAATDADAVAEAVRQFRMTRPDRQRERAATAEPQLHTLGNLVGNNSHFGSCPTCGSQHMSTHDRVYVDPQHAHVYYCDRHPPRSCH
jgi:hypothetical protein